MSDRLIENNRVFLGSAKVTETPKIPRMGLAVISCMDARLTRLLPEALGIRDGDAAMIRNSGASIRDPYGDTMHSVLIAVYELGVTEIAVVGDPARGVKSGRFMLGANGKSMINGSNEGFIRVFCDETDKLVASEAMGGGVTELAGETALAIKCGLTARDVASTVHAHPTLYESVAEACEDIFGLATNKK